MGFQFKPELAAKILAGKKTQTRRPVKEDDYFSTGSTYCGEPHVSRNGRLLWYKAGIYAIQPGRGKEGIGHLQIKSITEEDVRYISHADSIAEGFQDEMEFLQVWTRFYDRKINISRLENHGFDWLMDFRPSGPKIEWRGSVDLGMARDFLIKNRPEELYMAYVISFEVVQS